MHQPRASGLAGPKLHQPAADYAGDHFRATQFAQTTQLREVRQERSNRGSSFSGAKEEVPSPILT